METQSTQRSTNRSEDIALFRYGLIRQAADVELSKAQRGRLVRELSSTSHMGPNGVGAVVVSRPTIDRWIRTYRKGGFQALHPSPRKLTPRTPEEVLSLACDLRREDPYRTAAHITKIIATTNGWAPSSRTLQRHFKALGLTRYKLTSQSVAFGRFEADYPNELWVGDALHGPVVGNRKAILFCFLDDHSRLVVAHHWTYIEDTLSAQGTLRRGILSRGLPKTVYLDNGSPFVSRQLLRSLGILGIRIVHSKPGRPQGRGKIERFFRTVRDQFLVEVPHSNISSIEVLQSRFQAWVEQVYHKEIHSETSQSPLERFAISPSIPDLKLVREAFLFSETRTVTKTSTVSLYDNTYEVDQALVGRKIELVFDPFDLSKIDVRYQERDFGLAVPFEITRHSHPIATKHKEPDPIPTGIDYLGALDVIHQNEVGTSIGYRNLVVDDQIDGDAS